MEHIHQVNINYGNNNQFNQIFSEYQAAKGYGQHLKTLYPEHPVKVKTFVLEKEESI